MKARRLSSTDPSQMRPRRFRPSGPLRGTIRVPGDKSISHRAIMLGALAVGETRISGLLEGEDVLATAAAMRAMGATILRQAQDDRGNAEWRVHGVGVGGLLQPQAALDMGNSGTSTRLLMGLVASHPITATFVGDASLSKRPMGRVIEPLSQMSAAFEASEGGRLPLNLRGAQPAVPITYRLPVASAQVKSAVLLAGLNTPGITTVIEPVPTRDHSERMLRGFGADLTVEIDAGGARVIRIVGEAELRPQVIEVPGDPSSAAFFIVAALLVPGSELTIENVGLNPTRAGLIAVLRQMGGSIKELNPREVGGEPVADLLVRHSALTGIEVDPSVAPSMIDEFPVLFVAAALASGRTVTTGLEELRVKESDRLSAMAAALTGAGARVTETGDGLIIDGTGGELLRGSANSRTKTHLDHRIAMSMAVAGLASRDGVEVDDTRPIATSFPVFEALLDGLMASPLPPAGGGLMIIAVDGPTASGKGTIAKALAAHFGLPHLDTGLLYRAVGRQCFLDGGDPDDGGDALAATRFPDNLLTDPELRSEATGGLASRVSVHPAVRQALYERQRAFATQPGGAVLDGRDIGTVIAPEAEVKLFVVASVPARAERRLAEMQAQGRSVSLAEIAADLELRDKRDRSRTEAPLVAASDATLLDTSDLTVEVAIALAIRLVEARAA